MALAGMLEIVDREFQAIQDEDSELKKRARESVQSGEFSNVEITADALHAYLDKKLGPDARVSDWSYSWTARILLGLGFRNLQEVDECIAKYDGDLISRTLYGARQGQITRFEGMLLAGMGESFIRNHVSAQEDWFASARYDDLAKLRRAGIHIGDYKPRAVLLPLRPITHTV
jgi:hypothetical protein